MMSMMSGFHFTPIISFIFSLFIFSNLDFLAELRSTAVIYTHISKHILQFNLCHSVNISSHWLREQFSNFFFVLTVYTEQQIFLPFLKDRNVNFQPVVPSIKCAMDGVLTSLLWQST
jgi:hypothetical protein